MFTSPNETTTHTTPTTTTTTTTAVANNSPERKMECVWINSNCTVTHGYRYFYANVDKFKLDSESIIDCGLSFYVKSNDFHQKYGSQCNANGAQMIYSGKWCKFEWFYYVPLLFLDIIGNLTISDNIEWSTQLIISCKELLSIEQNSKIENVINHARK